MLISKEITGGTSQTSNYREVYIEGKHRLLINIKADSFDLQCYATISHFVNGTWESIYELLPTSFDVKGATYQKDVSVLPKVFKPIRDKLHEIAMKVLA